MMVTDFYTIDDFQQSDNEISAKIILNPDHKVYKGHFPEQAVVPGVLQIQMIKELTEKAIGQKLMLSKMDFAKFLHLVLPEENTSLDVIIHSSQALESLKVSATIKDENLVFTKLKGDYKIK